MNSLKKLLLLLTLAFSFNQTIEAQRVAVGTDIVEWCASTPNIDIEARLSHRLSLDVSVGANPLRNYFGYTKISTANLHIQPELRYWFNRPMARHFVGINALAGVFDVRLNNRCYKGDLFAVGAKYGYSLVLNRHWNIVFSGGVGLGYVHGYSFIYGENKSQWPNLKKVVPVPDVSVTFSYIFK